ncbi:RluA family pseudouridine synthase [Helicobacter sp.]|uniref:RluA family pseudouridine synthase n=1 Tax=Helicobacter sp. TaxID=218 RepID=UPI0025BA26E1|nr:RluA family pseudouridine synthase [Helicobacter sp.]MCI5969005.1 RluA family pseudouridine synthase [Helicobacter sp.]
MQEKNKILYNRVEVLVFKPESIGLKPLFENEDFAIFNKPSKMLIHPKGRFAHHSFMDEVRTHLGEGANLTHRIDKETSGLVLVGKHKKSISEFGLMFLNNAIKKEYLALTNVKNGIQNVKTSFSLSLPLATQEKGGDLCVRSVYWKAGHTQAYKMLNFKDAQSDFEVLGIVDFNDEKMDKLTEVKINENSKFLLFKVLPKTGRTHQIRLHLQALGIPILGDPLYGVKDAHSREYLDGEFISKNTESNSALSDEKRLEYFGAKRLMLHAYGLQFCYKGKNYCFRSIENFDIIQRILVAV